MFFMTPLLTVIALVNGMIGGVMLVLPVLLVNSGTVISFFIILITGFLSFYSCYLYLQHLGSNTDIDKAIYYHFQSSKSIKVIYDFIVFLNLLLILISYFLLIAQQWNNMLNLSQTSILNPLLNVVGLLTLILVLKYIRFGAHLLGYGVISIALYCVFLVWMVSTAPTTPSKIPPIGNNLAGLAAAMGQAFSIQQFFIPILKQLPIKFGQHYIRYTKYVYFIGGVTYVYIAYAGAFGIVNRPVITSPAQTITDFFNNTQWQVIAIQSIYLLHLYSAYGEFILIAKKRFFSILKTIWKIKNSRRKQFFTIPQVIFLVTVLSIGLIFYFTQITLQHVIIMNGGVLGFFFIYLFPALLHFKCLYFSRPKQIYVIQDKETKINYHSSEHTKQLELSQKYDLSKEDQTQRQGYVKSNNQEKQIKISINQQKSEIRSHILQNDKQNQSKASYKLSNIGQQKQKPIQDKLSVLDQKLNIQEQEGLAADQSLIMSEIGDKDTKAKITKLNQECPCKKIGGWWKIMDFLSIAGMVVLGLYIMVYSIIEIIQQNK